MQLCAIYIRAQSDLLEVCAISTPNLIRKTLTAAQYACIPHIGIKSETQKPVAPYIGVDLVPSACLSKHVGVRVNAIIVPNLALI
jgi:hypothetical protein